MKYSFLTLCTVATIALSCSNNAEKDTQNTANKDSIENTTSQSNADVTTKMNEIELPTFKDESVNAFLKEYTELTKKMESEPTNEELQQKFMSLTNELSTIQSKMSTEEQKKWIEYSNKISE